MATPPLPAVVTPWIKPVETTVYRAKPEVATTILGDACDVRTADAIRIVHVVAPTRCPECVGKWFNAMDSRDVVALYPLDAKSFPLNPENPAIENKTDVRNRTSNRHGIAGYLDDQTVATRIYDALTA